MHYIFLCKVKIFQLICCVKPLEKLTSVKRMPVTFFFINTYARKYKNMSSLLMNHIIVICVVVTP